jgi:universal stress protein A
MDIKKILCPVDLSDTSRRAMEAAADLSKLYDAPLTILHVLSGSGASRGSSGFAGVAMGSRCGGAETSPEERHALEILSDWGQQAGARGAVRVTTDTSRGDAAGEIRRMAEDGGYDLIVLGTHGQTGMLQALLGSVTYKLVRSAPCSVLTVKART